MSFNYNTLKNTKNMYMYTSINNSPWLQFGNFLSTIFMISLINTYSIQEKKNRKKTFIKCRLYA